MAVIDTYTQQPADRLDYDIPYVLTSPDTLNTVQVTVAPVGLTVDAGIIGTDKVKLWVEGGTAGIRYKIDITVTTTLGRIKQDELYIRVKEY